MKGRMLWIRLAVIFGWALLLRWPVVNIPLERDEGEYAYMAQRMLAGATPYKETFDQKPPGSFFVYALIERWIGTSPTAIHWATQVYTLGTLVLVFLIGEKLFSGLAGVLAAMLTALMMTDASVVGNASNTETFMVLPMMGALYAALVVGETASVGWGFGAGALIGLSLLFKQVAATNGAFVLIYFAVAAHKRRVVSLSALAGVSTVFVIIAAYFISKGAWTEFYDCVIKHNLGYIRLTPLSLYRENFNSHFTLIFNSFWPVYGIAVCGLLLAIRGASSRTFRLLSGWFLFSCTGVAVGGYFRSHYFIQVVPAVALLAAGAMDVAVRTYWPRRALNLSIILMVLIVKVAVAHGAWYYAPGDPDKKALKLYGGENTFSISWSVGQFLKAHSSLTDRLFVFGSEPQLYYYASRVSASRYMFVYPLMTNLPDAESRQRCVLDEIRSCPPIFIVTVFIPGTFSRHEDSPSLIYENLYDILMHSYEVVGLVPLPLSGQMPTLQTGLMAKARWQKSPYWYEGSNSFLMTLWQRKDS